MLLLLQARVEFDLTKYNNNQDVITAIKNIKYIGGTTNTPDGMRKAV